MTAACPACAAAEPVVRSPAGAKPPTHHLVLPTIHCVSCIRGVEDTLRALPGIEDARVNLSRKRVAIVARDAADPTPWIAALARAGFEAHEADVGQPAPGDDYLIHLGVAGFAMMNVMLLSVAVWSGADGITRDFLHWISAAIALPATAFAAQPFFRSAWPALRAGRLNMDVPISLAILLACATSLYEIAHGGERAWFDAALSLTFFLLAGRVLDQRLRRAARSAADNLAALEPSRVTVLHGAERMTTAIADVAIGDRLALSSGARVPVDAFLENGSASVDRSALTGESDPITCEKGAPLYAGDVLLSGPHVVVATRVGEDTTLRRIAQMVATAEAGRGKMRSLADKAASVYTPLVHIVSATAFLGWLLATGDVRMALNVAVSTLIITCPCALGLAVPAVAVTATSTLYRAGFLVKSDTALERLAQVDTVVFDKTGTLTSRDFSLPDHMTPEHRNVLAALARGSDHPLSRAVATLVTPTRDETIESAQEVTGKGVYGTWKTREVALERAGADDPSGLRFKVGADVYHLADCEAPIPGAKTAVGKLTAAGVKVWMVTGDNAANAARAARDLGIDRIEAMTKPDDKVAFIEALQNDGAKVLMVGDGLNDTAALAAAHASIAPGSALDASRNAADINIVTGDLSKVPDAIALARRARLRILQNFALAAAYNLIAVPIAVSGFATPLAAAIAMSVSSITVILNAQRGLRT